MRLAVGRESSRPVAFFRPPARRRDSLLERHLDREEAAFRAERFPPRANAFDAQDRAEPERREEPREHVRRATPEPGRQTLGAVRRQNRSIGAAEETHAHAPFALAHEPLGVGAGERGEVVDVALALLAET